MLPVERDALNLPWTPAFLHKQGGMVFSMGQFMQWVGAQVQSTGTVQIWPGTPVAEVLRRRGQPGSRKPERRTTSGLSALREQRLVCVDQGVNKLGAPSDGFTPGMDVHAALTIVGDGPVGAIGRQLDAHFGCRKDIINAIGRWA
jgi:electron-transferring-flavoprotein dehydrogenase